MKTIRKIFVGGGKTSTAPHIVEFAAATARRANKGRAALYETDGGVSGEELSEEQVKRRSTLLGN